MGGLVIDVRNGEIFCGGLSVPHSPRLHNGNLLLLDSGYFGYVDLKSGKFERITFFHGYARGLSFINDFAVVVLENHIHPMAIRFKSDEIRRMISVEDNPDFNSQHVLKA